MKNKFILPVIAAAGFAAICASMLLHGKLTMDYASSVILYALLVFRMRDIRKIFRTVCCAVLLLLLGELSYIEAVFPWLYLVMDGLIVLTLLPCLCRQILNPCTIASRAHQGKVIEDKLCTMAWLLLMLQNALSYALMASGAHWSLRLVLPLVFTIPVLVYLLIFPLFGKAFLITDFIDARHALVLKARAPEELQCNDEEREFYKTLFLGLEKWLKADMAFLSVPVSLEDAATYLGTNRTYVSNAMHIYAKKPYKAYVNDLRLEYAVSLFRKNPELTVGEVSRMARYNVPTTMSMAFRKKFGMTPRSWLADLRNSRDKD